MPFTFQSNIARLVLWSMLIIVLAMDAYGVWVVFIKSAPAALFMKIFMLLGIGLKLAILFCLILSKGPIKTFIYIWAGLFILSGSTGLLAFVLSAQIEPVQAYFDKVVLMCAGVVLIAIASKMILVSSGHDSLDQSQVN